MFCTNCGKQIEDASSFCPFCGANQKIVGGGETTALPGKTTKIASGGVAASGPQPTTAIPQPTTMMSEVKPKSSETPQPTTRIGQPTTLMDKSGDGSTPQPTTLIEQPTTLIGDDANRQSGKPREHRSSGAGQPEAPVDPLAGFFVLAEDPRIRQGNAPIGSETQQTPSQPAPDQTMFVQPQTWNAPPPPAPNPMPASQDAQPPKPRKRRRKLIIVIVIIIALLVAAGAVAGVLWFQHEAAEKALREGHPVPLTIVADGYDDECTKFPVQAIGTDLDGAEVDQMLFVDGEGEGVVLPKGHYELTFPASPLTPDGILYNPPTSKIDLEISSDLEPGQSVDVLESEEFVYKRSTALDETDTMISLAVEAAREDPDADEERISELEEIAVKAHADAVASAAEEQQEKLQQKAEQEAERAAAEAKEKQEEAEARAKDAYSNPSSVDASSNATATLKGKLLAQPISSSLKKAYEDADLTAPTVIYVLRFDKTVKITASAPGGSDSTRSVSEIQVDYDSSHFTLETFDILMNNYVGHTVSIRGDIIVSDFSQTAGDFSLVMTSDDITRI